MKDRIFHCIESDERIKMFSAVEISADQTIILGAWVAEWSRQLIKAYMYRSLSTVSKPSSCLNLCHTLRLTSIARDQVCQLPAHCRVFSPGTPPYLNIDESVVKPLSNKQ